ncbi:MAG: hypothetical protein KDB79_10035 [Acidobacteria bacterium]|nr:hypothetical protein [Acidobacteriota bacterium]
MKQTNFAKILVVCATLVVSLSAQQEPSRQSAFERRPFQKSSYLIRQPVEKSFRADEKGNDIDVKARVVEVDKKTGKYEFRWLGVDGKEKIVEYQRHDSIDAIVRAEVEAAADGKYIYSYDFRVLPESPTFLSAFTVQTFANDIEPVKLDKKLFIFGSMKFNPMFNVGVWWDWGFIGDEKKRIQAGDSAKFKLVSLSPPGIVDCKVTGGALGTKGVGEDIPGPLEDQIPIFQDLAWGYTIAPDKRLLKFSEKEKIEYLLENLPKIRKAGWISDETEQWYQQILKNSDLDRLFEIAKRDLEERHIANEVFHIIDGLRSRR